MAYDPWIMASLQQQEIATTTQAGAPAAAPAPAPEAQWSRTTAVPRLLAIPLLIALGFLAYANSLSGYFYCDDFQFIPYVHAAWHGQAGRFIEIFTTPVYELQPFLSCYRPLPFLSMLLEYLLAGTNPFWYHFTNVTFHTICASALFVIARRLKFDPLPAFMAAALFAVYPLSVEAVNAPVNIVTVLGACFALLAVAAFLSGRRAATGVCLLLGLLCKEQAAVLPILFTAGIYLNSSGTALDRCKSSLRAAAPFWCILAAYLIARSLVLGPIIGGYQGPVGDWLVRSFKDRIFSGWPMLCVFPLNAAMFSPDTFVRPLLTVLYIGAGLLGARRWWQGETIAGGGKSAAFLVLWLLVTLLVGMPVWNLEDTLAGSRHIYLASAPLVLLFVACTYNAKLKRAWTAICGALLACFVPLTIMNNDAWLAAGTETAALKCGVEQAVGKLAPEQRLVLINPPQLHKGVYLFSSSYMLRSMFKGPITAPDISQRIETLSPWYILNHDLFDVARLRRLSCSPDFQLAYWDTDTKSVLPLATHGGHGTLTEPLRPIGQHIDQTHQLSIIDFAGDLRTLADQADFVEVQLACRRLPGVPAGTKAALSLSWQSADRPLFTERRTQYLPVIDDGAPHTYRFPLSDSLDWLTAQHNGHLRLCMPSPNFANQVLSANITGWRHMAPTLQVDEGTSHTIGLDGVVDLRANLLTLNYDVRYINGATTALVEISRADSLLELGIPRGPRSVQSPQAAHQLRSQAPVGSVEIASAQMGRPGLYEVEAVALDGHGNLLGNFSAPLFIQVRPRDN